MKAVILRWIPACGKSSVANIYADSGYVVISKDTLRAENPEHTEKEIGALQEILILEAKDKEQDIVIDNTHCKSWQAEALMIHLTSLWFTTSILDVFANLVEQYEWDSLRAVRECIFRNMSRSKRVPQSVIWKMYFQLGYNLWDGSLAVFDLDWTLYDISERLSEARREDWSIDWDIAFKDELIKKDKIQAQVKKAMALYDKVIIVSWRSNACEEATLAKLASDDVRFDTILMRDSWDRRPDERVKGDLHSILDKAGVKINCVYDDRKSVIDMWKSKGIYVFNCCQLENNDF